MNHLGGCKLQARDAREGKASAVFRSLAARPPRPALASPDFYKYLLYITSLPFTLTCDQYWKYHIKNYGSIILTGTNPAQLQRCLSGI